MRALRNISLAIGERIVTAFIGPSGCGKSTLLRCFNRMNDLIDNVRIEGAVNIGGHDINHADVDVIELRKRVGMVFQRSNPFPKSVYENIAYGLRLHGTRDKPSLDGIVEQSLRVPRSGMKLRSLAYQRVGSIRRSATAVMHRPRNRH